MTISFKQFQASRKRVADVNEAIGVASDAPASGFVYRDDLHIFDMPDAGYLLVIGNQQKVSVELSNLEWELYMFGVREGMLS